LTLISAKVKPYGLSCLFHANLNNLSQLVWINFGLGLSMYLDRNFGLRLLLSKSLSPNSLSKITF